MIDLATLLDEIKVARLRPGDVILVKTPAVMLDYEVERILSTVQHWFPHNDVRILAGIDIEVVRPTEVQFDPEGPDQR